MATGTKNASATNRLATNFFFRCLFLALVPLLLTGCYTVHIAECTVPDNQTNRTTATNIVASVAAKHGFVARPEQADQMVMLASYDFLDTQAKHPLSLDIFADAGSVTTILTQTNKSKTRTDSFLSVQRDLVKQFRERFGSTVEINSYNQENQP